MCQVVQNHLKDIFIALETPLKSTAGHEALGSLILDLDQNSKFNRVYSSLVKVLGNIILNHQI
jgi:hypothetical protein